MADTLTNINAISDTIMNNTKLNQITANSILISQIGSVGDATTLSGKTKVAAINVSDSWANIKTYFSTGPGTTQNSKVKSFTVV